MSKKWNSNIPPVRINKTCSICGESKSIDLFSNNSYYGDKKNVSCKICRANYKIRSRTGVDSGYIDKILFNTDAYAYAVTVDPIPWDENGFIYTQLSGRNSWTEAPDLGDWGNTLEGAG